MQNPTATSPERTPCHTPAVEIFEDDQAIVVSADLPGVTQDHLEIALAEGILTVEGRVGAEGACARRYRRRFALSDPTRFDTERITAALRHGVLELRLPKSDRSRRREIPVAAV
jgi:HSP20 family protein